MKKVAQMVLLAFAIIGAFTISFLGPSDIAKIFQISPADVYPRSVLFLMGTFFVELFLERITTFNQIDFIEETIRNNISPFFERFLNGKPRRFNELLLKYVFRGDGRVDGRHSFNVNPGSTLPLWRDCISEAGTWEALSYSRELWENEEREKSEAHQEVFIKLVGPGHLKRVFVFDSNLERQNFQNNPDNAAIISRGDIKWVIKKDWLHAVDARLRDKLSYPDLIDFAIVDHHNYVLWFHLDKTTRKLNFATMSIDDGMVAEAHTKFEIAYSLGQPFMQGS